MLASMAQNLGKNSIGKNFPFKPYVGICYASLDRSLHLASFPGFIAFFTPRRLNERDKAWERGCPTPCFLAWPSLHPYILEIASLVFWNSPYICHTHLVSQATPQATPASDPYWGRAYGCTYIRSCRQTDQELSTIHTSGACATSTSGRPGPPSTNSRV